MSVNAAPVANILMPTDGAKFYDPDSILVEAVALEANDTMLQVEFFLDDESIGIDTIPPFWQGGRGKEQRLPLIEY